MDFSIEIAQGKLPKILNGQSANTLYWLIEYPKRNPIDAETMGSNYTHLAYPHDHDDFSRCYMAYKHFGWTDLDLAAGYNRLFALGIEEGVLKHKLAALLRNFRELVFQYEKCSSYQEFTKFLQSTLEAGYVKNL